MNKELGIVASLVTMEALRFRILDLGVVGASDAPSFMVVADSPESSLTSSARIRSGRPGTSATDVFVSGSSSNYRSSHVNREEPS